jgi:hypothetical protein
VRPIMAAKPLNVIIGKPIPMWKTPFF